MIGDKRDSHKLNSIKMVIFICFTTVEFVYNNSTQNRSNGCFSGSISWIYFSSVPNTIKQNNQVLESILYPNGQQGIMH